MDPQRPSVDSFSSSVFQRLIFFSVLLWLEMLMQGKVLYLGCLLMVSLTMAEDLLVRNYFDISTRWSLVELAAWGMIYLALIAKGM
jgi:hypothetical protein